MCACGCACGYVCLMSTYIQRHTDTAHMAVSSLEKVLIISSPQRHTNSASMAVNTNGTPTRIQTAHQKRVQQHTITAPVAVSSLEKVLVISSLCQRNLSIYVWFPIKCILVRALVYIAVLQCVAVCCGVLQCVWLVSYKCQRVIPFQVHLGVCSGMYSCVTVWCGVLQCVAVCCSVIE